MDSNIVAGIIEGGATLAGVVVTIRSQTQKQTQRIDADNQARLAEQTGELKQHLKGDGS